MANEKEQENVQVVNEDDDFDVSTLPKSETEKQENGQTKEKADDTKAANKPDDKIDDDQEQDKGDDKPDDIETGKDNDEAGDKSDKGKDDDQPGDTTDTDKDDEDEDIFAEAPIPGTEDKKDDIDFSAMIGELGIETDEEIKDSQAFLQATKKAIDSAKQKFDISQYSEEAQRIINFANENKGSIVEFFENPVITNMNSVLSMAPEDRYRQVRYSELLDQHKDEEKAIEALEEEMQGMSKGEIKTKSELIEDQAKKIRQAEIDKLITQGQEKTKSQQIAEQNKAKEQKQNIINYVDKQESFFGLSLSKEAKKAIIKDIDNGKFDEIVEKTPQASKFFAYMVGKYGSKITDKYASALKDANRKGYNESQDREFNALHKSTKGTATGKAGHQDTSGTKKNFENLTPDVFGEDE